LGQLLAEVERAKPDYRTLGAARPASLKAYIKTIGLKETSAKQAQRIGTLPEDELLKILAKAREQQEALLAFDALITLARPYWYSASRENLLFPFAPRTWR
jgi:hypothetical protein